jgi:exportin-2 (importin alpha re-exporter)
MEYNLSKLQFRKWGTLLDGYIFRMFGMVLEKLLISELQKVSGNVERKIVACGITKLLCECPELYKGTYQKYWSQLLQVSSNR